jgi:hypothetical protein
VRRNEYGVIPGSNDTWPRASYIVLGAGQDRPEDSQADVVPGPRPAPARREDQLASRDGCGDCDRGGDSAGPGTFRPHGSPDVFECRTWITTRFAGVPSDR